MLFQDAVVSSGEIKLVTLLMQVTGILVMASPQPVSHAIDT
jgi:hypothetical protein